METVPSSLMVSVSPYCPRCASSIITTTLLRPQSGSSRSVNFCMVVKTMPLASLPSRSLLRSSREIACTGVWRRKAEHRENWPNSWSSRSFLSVMTTIVGLSMRSWSMWARKTIESDLPEPCVCQKTPILPSPETASTARSAALCTPKYWWYAARILTTFPSESLKQMKLRRMSQRRSLRNMPSMVVCQRVLFFE